MIEHIHSHRNLIGFDENGIPTVTLRATPHDPEDVDAAYRRAEEIEAGACPEEEAAHHHHHHHEDVPEEEDDYAFIRDYMNAVAAYRKTFPSAQEQIEKTPDPAVR